MFSSLKNMKSMSLLALTESKRLTGNNEVFEDVPVHFSESALLHCFTESVGMIPEKMIAQQIKKELVKRCQRRHIIQTKKPIMSMPMRLFECKQKAFKIN